MAATPWIPVSGTQGSDSGRFCGSLNSGSKSLYRSNSSSASLLELPVGEGLDLLCGDLLIRAASWSSNLTSYLSTITLSLLSQGCKCCSASSVAARSSSEKSLHACPYAQQDRSDPSASSADEVLTPANAPLNAEPRMATVNCCSRHHL